MVRRTQVPMVTSANCDHPIDSFMTRGLVVMQVTQIPFLGTSVVGPDKPRLRKLAGIGAGFGKEWTLIQDGLESGPGPSPA